MMFRITICDDCEEDLSYIESHLRNGLSDKNLKAEISAFTDPQKLLSQLCSGTLTTDVVLVDIDMPVMNGLEFAEKLNENCPGIEIVFITNHDEFVYTAYRCKAIGFIRKKFIDRELGDEIDVIFHHLTRKNAKIIIDEPGNETAIGIWDLVYAKSDDHYVELHTKDGKSVMRKSINRFETDYAAFGLIRVHIRYIINVRFIQAIEKKFVLLKNNEQIPISREKEKYVKERFQYFSRIL
jgi:DNA-binding LytR/AlgR family response regulator